MPHDTHVVALRVRDQPGVLVRVAQVFARRGCNIQAIVVEPQQDTGWSVMRITVHGVSDLTQIMAQLDKLIDVHTVELQEAAS